MDAKRVRVVRLSLTEEVERLAAMTGSERPRGLLAELRGKRPGYRPAARARGLLRHLRMRQRRNLEEA